MLFLFLIKYGIMLEIIWNNGFLPLEGEGVPVHVLVEWDGRGEERWKDLCSVLDPFRLLSLKKVQKPPCPPAENAGQACQGKEQKILLFLIK